MSIIDQLEKEKRTETGILKHICNELRKIPQGSLTAVKAGNNTYITAHLSSGDVKLGNADKIRESDYKTRVTSELTARHCIEKMKGNIENNLGLIDRIIQKIRPYDPNDLIPELTSAYREVTDGIFSHTGFPDLSKLDGAYGSDEYFRSGGRIHRTVAGAMVRTRVEVAIADNYTMRGLNYIYEQKLILPDGTTLHPDFTVNVPGTDKVIYHEHLGLLDREDYIQSTLWKLDKYIRAGIYPNRDLILTVEEPDTGLDMEKLNQMIDCFLF